MTCGYPPGPEQTDVDLAVQEVNGELVTVVAVTTWSRLRVARLDLAVLIAAEGGGQDAVTSLLRSSMARFMVGARCRTEHA